MLKYFYLLQNIYVNLNKYISESISFLNKKQILHTYTEIFVRNNKYFNLSAMLQILDAYINESGLK